MGLTNLLHAALFRLFLSSCKMLRAANVYSIGQTAHFLAAAPPRSPSAAYSESFKKSQF
jgi:hypothetical protein